MFNLIYFIGYPPLVFWLIRTLKAVLFWLYLWQLKEYHIGRFLDHFKTIKGREAVFNNLLLVKFFILGLFSAYYFFTDPGYLLLGILILTFIYIAEAYKAIVDLLSRKIKAPKFTFKVALIFSVILALFFIFTNEILGSGLANIYISILLFDLLLPIIVSAVVLSFQPFFVSARNRILKKARKKISQYKNLTVIAITGSYGKTSTKEFLKTILSLKSNVLATPEHKNSEMGIAYTILNDLNGKHQIFIVEMGAYKKGGIKLLCDIVKPKIGIVTGVNEQHLATFGSMENLLSAEGGRELLENLPKDGLIIVNGENKHCVKLYQSTSINKKIYAASKDKINADLWAENISVKEDHLEFNVETEDGESEYFAANVLGVHNIQNLLAAVTAALKLDMSLKEISQACQKIQPEQSGIVLKKGINEINVIDSSYSANPNGVMADLSYLSIFHDKKVIVMPCLIELGEKSVKVHENIGKKIAEVCDLAIITTKDKFEEIKKGAELRGMARDKIKFMENSEEIFDILQNFFSKGDAVLLEGRVPSELIKLLVNDK